MLYTFDHPRAKSRRTNQHFEALDWPALGRVADATRRGHRARLSQTSSQVRLKARRRPV
jgi:hypothetical protein